MIRFLAALFVLLLAVPAAAQLPAPVDVTFAWDRGQHDDTIAATPDTAAQYVGQRLIKGYVFVARDATGLEVGRVVIARGDPGYAGANLLGATVALPVAEGFTAVLHAQGQDGRLSEQSNAVLLVVEAPPDPTSGSPVPAKITGFKKAGQP